MFNKNKKKWNQNKIKNDEGYTVYKMRDDQALFLEASSFTPRNSFYKSVEQRLKHFEKLINDVLAGDIKFVVALTWYLGRVMGIRLAPVIMTMKLSGIATKEQLERIIKDVFTRPDFISNAFGYWKHRNGDIKSFPKDIFALLKLQIASFSDITLKGRKMLHRDFKLKDLIKILKPKPISPELSKLYRAIIEDGKASKLSVVVKDGEIKYADHVTAAISSDKVSHKEKQEFVRKDLLRIPINALIRNLSFLTAEDAPLLKTRLEDIFKKGSGLRFINPFDLIFLESVHHVGFNKGVRVPPEIINVCDQILKKFVTFDCRAQKPVILYDRSGSMKDGQGEAHRNGSKFLAMLNNIFKKDFKFYSFASRGYGHYSHGYSRLAEFPAAIEDETEKFKTAEFSGPNEIARHIHSVINCHGGTELLEATKWTIDNNPDMDLFIIITDEQTWADPAKIEAYRRMIPDNLAGKVLLINVAPDQTSVFKPSAKIIRISGLDGKIIKLIEAIVDFDAFKRSVINQFDRN